MKRTCKFMALVALTSAILVGCSNNDENDAPKGETFDLGDGSNAYKLTADTKLTYPNTYNLKGFVYVTEGKTLTIEPGVIIKGDKETEGTLIVERGGKLIAQGSKERPIVFTSAMAPGSRKPGDWGGIIILGKAKNNKGDMGIEGGVTSLHGGNDDGDNSGVLSYVRCEFAGVEYSVDNEINGITFGSVGRGTKVDHVQVSYSGDDAFEWFGGCVDAKYLVALGTWDDDFDTDNGYSGRVQYGVALRNPSIADKSASNAFESDNDKEGGITEQRTKPVFANVSVFGAVTNPASFTDQGNTSGSSAGVFQAALQIRRSSQLNIFNSLLAGFPIGIIVENDKIGSDARESATAGLSNINNCVVAGMIYNFQDKATNKKPAYDASYGNTFVKSYYEGAGRANREYASIADLKLTGNPQNLSAPNMIPASDSPLATGAAWTHANVSSWFDKVSYVGAFSPTETSASSWMSGWCNFDPQNTIY